MSEKFSFIKLPLLLFLIFFTGRFAIGLAGGSYDTANRVFSMVILQVHVALLWSAVGRRYRGYKLSECIVAIVMIVAFSQILIVTGTAVSYAAGLNTPFNNPITLVGDPDAQVPFSGAMVSRAIGLVVNCIIGAILASLGYALGALVPERRT